MNKTKFNIGQSVYVATSLLPNPDQYDHSFYKTKVHSQTDRKVVVAIKNGEFHTVASSKVHKNIGIAIIEIGDLSTEPTLLDPLSTALHQFCRLILEDDAIGYIKLRSLHELDQWWQKNGAMFTHVIFVGHGSPTGVFFSVDGNVSPKQLDLILTKSNSSAVFLSLCCKTGNQSFAGIFSGYQFCSAIIAPLQSIHAASASQFAQTFLCWNLIEGKSTKIAFKSAKSSVAGRINMRMWKNGILQ